MIDRLAYWWISTGNWSSYLAHANHRTQWERRLGHSCISGILEVWCMEQSSNFLSNFHVFNLPSWTREVSCSDQLPIKEAIFRWRIFQCWEGEFMQFKFEQTVHGTYSIMVDGWQPYWTTRYSLLEHNLIDSAFQINKGRNKFITNQTFDLIDWNNALDICYTLQKQYSMADVPFQ